MGALRLLVVGTAACGAPALPAAPLSATARPAPPLSAGPFLQPADLDRLLPNPAVLVDRGPWGAVAVDDDDAQLLRGGCRALADDRGAASGTGTSGPTPTPTDSVTQVWRHNGTPEVASLDVLRWAGEEAPRSWVDGVVAASDGCGESVVLAGDHTAAGLPLTAVVRRWEGPHTGGTVEHPALPLWQVEAVVVSGTTGAAVQVGAFSATTAQGAWDTAEPATTGLVDLAVQRVAAADES